MKIKQMIIEREKLYSTGDYELDDLLEKAFCDGYEYAQREFVTPAQLKLAGKRLGVNVSSGEGKRLAKQYIGAREKVAGQVKRARNNAFNGTKINVKASGDVGVKTADRLGRIGNKSVHSSRTTVTSGADFAFTKPGKEVILSKKLTGVGPNLGVSAEEINSARGRIARDTSQKRIQKATDIAKQSIDNKFGNII